MVVAAVVMAMEAETAVWGDGEGVVASEVVPVAMAAAGSEAVVARAAAMGVGGVAAVEVVLAVASWASNASALQRNGA